MAPSFYQGLGGQVADIARALDGRGPGLIFEASQEGEEGL
jgi:hypothetical protein